jgi:hypothetical protein
MVRRQLMSMDPPRLLHNFYTLNKIIKKFLVDFLFQNSMFIVKKTLNLLLLVSNGISKEDQSFL